jgi:hypothetical protein
VALLLRDREAPPEAAAQPPGGGAPGPAPDFACEICGAALQGGQDWCLECGTAGRGRLGARPGWRSAFTVVGLTLLLVCGAVMATYAALTSDAERTASAPTAGNGAPVVPQTPGVPGPAPTTIQPGATGPGTTPPAQGAPGTPLPLPPTGTPLPPTGAPGAAKQPQNGTVPTGPVLPQTNRKITPPATSGTPAPSNGTTPTAPGTQQPATPNVPPQVIKLKSDAATSYDPSKRAGAEFGPAANAIDGKPDTVWDVTVPADGKPLGVGVLVDLGAPYALQSLDIGTPTPGFRAELYGAVDKAVPADVLDKRWQHLTDRKRVADGAPIALKGKGDAPKYRLFLVYVTLPAEVTDPRVAIGELTFRGTP